MHKAVHHLSLIAVVYVLTFLTNMPDFDLWARLAVGSIVFQTGHVLRHDVFSYLPTKALWIDHEWGAGVVLYGFAKLLGAHGIFLLKGLLLYAVFLLVGQAIHLRAKGKPPTALFFAFLGYALFPGIASLVRSHMFTYLFFVVWLIGLERLRQNQRRILWVFPCTMLFWVNMHAGFLAGIGLLLLYAVGDLLTRRNPLPYLWVALSILPVMLINPYGLALWRYAVEASLMPRPFIPEWNPVSLSGPMQVIGGLKVHFLTGYFVLVVLTFVGVLRSFVRKEKVDATHVLVVAALFVLSMRHQRHIVFFVLAASTLCYAPIVGLLEPLRRLLGTAPADRLAKRHAVARWGLGYALPAIVVLAIVPRLSHRMIIDYRRFPVGSLEFIRQNGIAGNVATAFDWGSYASWKLYPQCKIMLDGRYEEVFPNDVFDLAMRFAVRQGDWQEVLRRFPTDVVILPKTYYTRADLALLADWRPVYQDYVSVLLLPRDRIPATYVRPDYEDPAYATEDLSKPIAVLEASR